MAIISLAVDTTLARMEANVRSQANALDVNTTQLFPLQIQDIIHNAVVSVRNIVGKFIDEFYWTEKNVAITVNSGVYGVSLSGIALADINRVKFSDNSFGKVDIVSINLYKDLIRIYSAVKLAGAYFGTVLHSQHGANDVLGIKFYVGSAVTPSNNGLFSFYRSPIKAVVKTDMVDIPDLYVPLVQDISVMYVFEKLGVTPPGDFTTRVQRALQSVGSQVGIHLTPNTEGKVK